MKKSTKQILIALGIIGGAAAAIGIGVAVSRKKKTAPEIVVDEKQAETLPNTTPPPKGSFDAAVQLAVQNVLPSIQAATAYAESQLPSYIPAPNGGGLVTATQ